MPHRTKPHVYIAAPYSSPYPIYNVRTALEAANLLWSDGIAHPVVPHLTAFWDFAYPHPYEDWLALDLESMHACDAVWRLDGESKGADDEVRVAQDLGIPVFTTKDALDAFCTAWHRDRQDPAPAPEQ